MLISLNGSPKECNRFNCSSNNLTSLKGCPRIVNRFECNFNEIQSLEDGPDIVKDVFSVGYNSNIRSLKGAPKEVEILECSRCDLKTFEYFPKIKYLSMNDNPLSELWHLFDNVNYIEYFNELDIIIDDGETVILDRLNYFLQDLNIDKEITSLKNYNII